jgi:hypothetical protein
MANRIYKKLKFLFISSDKFPPFRPDVAVLFVKELSRRGHQIDFLLQAEADNNLFLKQQYQRRGFLWVRQIMGLVWFTGYISMFYP